MHICSVVSLLIRYFNVNVVHGGIVVYVKISEITCLLL